MVAAAVEPAPVPLTPCIEFAEPASSTPAAAADAARLAFAVEPACCCCCCSSPPPAEAPEVESKIGNDKRGRIEPALLPADGTAELEAARAIRESAAPVAATLPNDKAPPGIIEIDTAPPCVSPAAPLAAEAAPKLPWPARSTAPVPPPAPPVAEAESRNSSTAASVMTFATERYWSRSVSSVPLKSGPSENSMKASLSVGTSSNKYVLPSFQPSQSSELSIPPCNGVSPAGEFSPAPWNERPKKARMRDGELGRGYVRCAMAAAKPST